MALSGFLGVQRGGTASVSLGWYTLIGTAGTDGGRGT